MENKKTREIYKDDFADYLLCLALDVGEGMLKNGGEIARVEDTIERICYAYGAAHVECFSIISMISAAIRMPDGSYSSQLRRVRQTGNNFNALEKFNALSREICKEKPSLDEFDSKIHALKHERPYPVWLQLLASAFGTSVFCMFFGGGIVDSLVTFVLGFICASIINFSSPRLNMMAKTVVAGFVSTTLAGLSSMIVNGLNVDSVIIGIIMLLVPGMLLGTAMRDLLCGDLLAGMMKILQAILQVLMIGFGYLLSYSLIGNYLIPTDPKGSFPAELVTAVLASTSFAVIFKTNKRHIGTVAVCGLITYASYFLVNMWFDSVFWAAFISSVLAALFSEIMARVTKAPAVVVLIPGIISTVPGGYLYRGARDAIRGLDTSVVLGHFGDALAIIVGIAGGVVAISIIFGIISDYRKKRREKSENKPS